MVDRFPMTLSFEAASVGGPRAFGAGSYGLSVWTGDQLEYGNVGAFHPRLQRVPADLTGCVTSVRHQKLFFSASVLGAAIAASDNCHHSGNMRLRRAGSSWIISLQNELDTKRELQKRNPGMVSQRARKPRRRT
jgi:hypothetical protein